MATKAEEAKAGCWAKAADDEPVFVLRATDMMAPAAIRAWAAYAAAAGTPAAKVKRATDTAAEMEAWQQKHGKKVAD